MLVYEVFSLLPGFETNTWLVYDDETRQGVLVDPSAPSADVLQYISARHLQLAAIINTHGHADHIGGNAFFHGELRLPIWIHTLDAPMLNNPVHNLSSWVNLELKSPLADVLLQDGDTFEVGASTFTVIHTPGHTPGGICLYTPGLLFSGDTLFALDIGRTDLPGGNHQQLIDSIKNKLLVLPSDTLVLPGHEETSTIGNEIAHNPWIKD